MDRVEILIGKNNLDSLKKKKILVVGIGGVGSHVCESLVRNGFKNLTIVDTDIVEKSNFNRHVIGLQQYIGMKKIEAMKHHLLNIYDDLSIELISERFSFNNAQKILQDRYDFVVDAVDKLSDKIELILQCYYKKIRIISAMGAGGKFNPVNIKISDISESYGDRLLKRVKKNLKKHGIEKGITVVYCVEETKYVKISDNEKIIGSCSHIPAIFGNIISGFIFNYFVTNKCLH